MRVWLACAAALVALVAWGCATRCDDLVDELAACPAAGQGGSAGGDTGDECTDVEANCADCLLASGKSLCDAKSYGEAAASCAADCPP